MKIWVFGFMFLFLFGIFSVIAQDMIVLKNGNIIESKVMEISYTEIRYLRFDNLDGPTIVIPVSDVLSIRYENGNVDIFSDTPAPSTQVNQQRSNAIDTNKFIFGINANAGGAIGYAYNSGTGAGVNIELGKGNFNSEINLMFPKSGFGFLLTFNGLIHSHVGNFYIGGGLGYIWQKDALVVFNPNRSPSTFLWDSHIMSFGLNLGYKFVLSSGMYFRVGAYTGMAIDIAVLDWPNYGGTVSNNSGYSFYIKPDLAIGWTMR